MKRWKIVTILLLCLTLVSSIACDIIAGDAEEVSPLVEVVRGDLIVSISGSGNIVVTNEAKLSFGAGGKIDKMYVDEGDEIIKGEVLAKLDTSALELALTQAELGVIQAKLGRDEAEYNLEQLRDVLHASTNRVELAEAAFEAAEAQVEAAEQAVAEAQKQLDESSIIAPFDGVVASVDADEGDSVSAMMTIIYLIDSTSIELEVEVDEIDISEVKPGQRAIIEVDALPNVDFEGEVTSISPLSIEAAGVVLYEVKISLDVSGDSSLKPGMSAEADIVINERNNVLLVPNRAITKDSQGNSVVQVMVNEQIEERVVVTGLSDGFDTEITDGLTEGEEVVRTAS